MSRKNYYECDICGVKGDIDPTLAYPTGWKRLPNEFTANDNDGYTANGYDVCPDCVEGIKTVVEHKKNGGTVCCCDDVGPSEGFLDVVFALPISPPIY